MLIYKWLFLLTINIFYMQLQYMLYDIHFLNRYYVKGILYCKVRVTYIK